MFDRLPEYPWQQLKPYAALAASHPGGSVDLSIGSPVDPTPQVIQDALAAATNSPGYPTTAGTLELRETVVEWFARRRGVRGLTPEHVMPTIGSKEFISLLPLALGLGPGDVVVQPEQAYTAYAVGAALCGATLISADDPAAWPKATKLIWLNTPNNPTGQVFDVAQLRERVARARELGAVLASDECYGELGWEAPWDSEQIPSLLDPRVTEGDLSGLICAYSLSKQSNLAGYRAAFAVAEPAVVKSIVNLRMHAGMVMPLPIQKAMVAALRDEAHLVAQKEIYRARRTQLLQAVRAFGFRTGHSEAGLYIWATLGEDCWVTVKRMADLGIVVVPGSFYGENNAQFVRFSITATDENIALAAQRLREAVSVIPGKSQ